MNITINDFRQVAHHLNASITLDKNQQLTIKPGRVVRKLQTRLQRAPVINQLPQLRHQQIKNKKIKSVLLLAIAQEYGVSAARDVSKLPEYLAQHTSLSGRKIFRILQTLDQLYQPLECVEPLPKFIIDDLFEIKNSTTGKLRSTRKIHGSLSSVIAPYLRVDNRDALLHDQLKNFLFASVEDQKRYQTQLNYWLHRGQVSDELGQPLLKLSSKQGLSLYGLMCSYQRLPLSRPNARLPIDQADIFRPLENNASDFSTLPIARQLSIVGAAAAARVGYHRTIDPCTQKLLAVKGSAVPSSYYARALETQLSADDHRLKFIGDHVYSNLGLSAHFITRARACTEEAGGAEKKELSLVFGGFSSHPSLSGKLKQLQAILINLIGAPLTASLYREAAQLAAQSANYARLHGFDAFTVSGHSLGGSLAEYAMARHSKLIDRAVVFQPFHVMGKHREGLQGNQQALQRITVVAVKNDWVTSPLVHRPLKGTRLIVLSPERLDQNVHGKYDRRLFKAVLGNLSSLASAT